MEDTTSYSDQVWYMTLWYTTSSSSFSLRDIRVSETRERAWKSPHRERQDAAGREKNEGLQTKPKLLTLHGQMILECEVGIAIQIIVKSRVYIAAGVCLTDVDRLPLKSQSELCVVRETHKVKNLGFVCSPWWKMRDYALKTKAGSLIVKKNILKHSILFSNKTGD